MNDIIDYTAGSVQQVTVDGAMSPAQRAALPTRSVPQRQPAATPARPDNRSELRVLKSTVEGLQEKIARLEAGMSFLLQERHEAAQLVPR